VRPLLQATPTVPIVFPIASDPVGAGLVDSVARPGGNATGFMSFEYTLSGKWLELLKEIAPGVTGVAVLQDPTQGGGASAFAVIQAVAPSLGVEVTPVNLRDAHEIDRAVADFARISNGGLIVTGSASSNVHHKLIITLAARHKLPAIYFERSFVAGGGLISYGSDYIDHLSLPEIKSERIDGANLRGADWPRCGQRPAQHATLVHPYSAIGAYERHCNIFGTIEAGGEGAARRTPRHDQGSPVVSSRSASPYGHFAMVIAVRSADPGCPSHEDAGSKRHHKPHPDRE
jgi:ABC transporter substrate binding protein